MIRIVAVLSVVLVLLIGCDDQFSHQGNVVVVSANNQRTNSFENYPEQAASSFSVDIADTTGTNGCVVPPIALSNGDVIIGCSDGSIRMLRYGKIEWQFIGFNEPLAGSMCIASNGNLFGITLLGKVFCLNSNGVLQWKKDLQFANKPYLSSDIVCTENELIFTCTNKRLYKYTLSGTKQLESELQQIPSRWLCMDALGNIFFIAKSSTGSDSLVSFNKEGVLRWSVAFQNTNIVSNLVVKGENIFLGGNKVSYSKDVPVLHCLNHSGAVVWSKELPATPRGISLTNDSMLIVTSYNATMSFPRSLVSALQSTDGSSVWELWFDSTISSQPIISESYISFVGWKNKAIGLYQMSKQGELRTVCSLSDAPTFYRIPSYSSRGEFVFGLSDDVGTVTVGEGIISKLFPFL